MIRKYVFSVLVLLVGSLWLINQTAWGADPDSCKQVRMTSPGWTDIEATNAMTGIVLGALGYEQSIQNLSVPITYQGLRTGRLDVFLGNWMPTQKPLVEPLIQQRVIDVLGKNLENAKFTLAVPIYVAEAGVKSFGDLAKYADKFDHKIYGIEPGATGNQNIERMLVKQDFGLTDWKLIESSETGMLTQLARVVREKKWIVFLAWEPHLMNTKFNITYLKDGDAYFGPNYGGATVNTVARHGYVAQCPNVGRLFAQMKFDVGMETKIIAAIIGDKVDPKMAAARVLQEHPEMLGLWLAGVTTRSGDDGLGAVKTALGKFLK